MTEEDFSEIRDSLSCRMTGGYSGSGKKTLKQTAFRYPVRFIAEKSKCGDWTFISLVRPA